MKLLMAAALTFVVLFPYSINAETGDTKNELKKEAIAGSVEVSSESKPSVIITETTIVNQTVISDDSLVIGNQDIKINGHHVDITSSSLKNKIKKSFRHISPAGNH